MRTRLTLVALATTVAAILIAMLTAYRSVSPLIADQVERGLEDRAATVRSLLDAGAPLPVRPDTTEQLLLPDGTVRVLTPGREPLPVNDSDRAIARTGQGGSSTEVEIGSQTHGVITEPRPGGGALMVGQNYSEVLRIDREFFWRTASITVAAVLAAAVISWLAIGAVLRPMRRLAAATQRITTTRDLSTVLPDAGRDEVGELTRDFNAMLAALRLSRAQQHRLVQDAGHELRTPLTSVRGSAELLQRAQGRLGPADESQVLTTLVQEAKALDALVGELVELATDQHVTEPTAPLELSVLAEDCAQRFRRRTGRVITVRSEAVSPRSAATASVPSDRAATDPSAASRDAEAVGQAAAAATVLARPRALARCVDNLLDNATKFSPADTEVEVRVRGTELAVLDRGPGIDAADQRAVFDRFYRADRTRATPGSGLGLAIVHDIITAHAGTVYTADRPGGGAEVGFQLPG
ncbi:HAMP domain-containing protein [Nocardia sp. ET3-3]|uniref:histidine kinase n=1 Tax=Nocardia terrae TaxID=2675851 RepID=A0A7K1V9X1_9NOCA|nr:HAMP domain-containing sensor histidine kinase [Nocardia terrae]MVU83443.1 HAMP domain-containing protein [Nocardia terrae]